ncbi:MAG: SDR family NAD(P)-dependent oxidoreductase [Bacillota bacterium]|nr:SDR family NAD(P)-dependent oxidoreductase [Bacillota bacterium]
MGKISVDLTGENAIVTGAGKGIGRAIALKLAESGAKVFAVSRTLKDLEVVRDEIRKGGGECSIFSCDVQNVNQISEMVDKVSEEAGKIDILVNSAGLNIQAHTLDVTEEQWDTVINTNLKGSFFTSQAAARKMKEFNEGRIISITSQMAFVGFFKRAAYCASKGGLTQATKAMAVELAEFNIKVNCVAPTFLKTPLTEPMFEDIDFYNEVLSRIPLGKIGTPDDVVGAVLYLCSDSADLITGSTILVDGGWVAW